MEVLDPLDLEADLCKAIDDARDEILKHMGLTEKLTNEARGTRKSYFEAETGKN